MKACSCICTEFNYYTLRISLYMEYSTMYYIYFAYYFTAQRSTI